MLRSEKVERILMYFGGDDLRDIFENIGNSEIIQFVNIDSVGKKEQYLFDSELKNLEKLEQRINYFKNDIKIVGEHDKPEIKQTYEKIRADINEYYTRLVELRHIQKNHEEAMQRHESNYIMAAVTLKYLGSVVPEDSFTIDFDFVTGIINRERKFLTRKTLKRRLRRNVLVKMVDVEMETTNKQQTVLIVYALGDEAIRTVCDIIESLEGKVYSHAGASTFKKQAFNDTGVENKENNIKKKRLKSYPIQRQYSSATATEYVQKFRLGFKRLRYLCQESKKQIAEFLKKAGSCYITWKYYINRERKLLETMNMLCKQENTNCFIGEGWILQSNIDKLKSLRKSVGDNSGRFAFEIIKTDDVPPTYFHTSRFNEAFQGFTNVFGVPKYREINPAMFLIFSFPFMFGAMFGDILHGLILAGISAAMIAYFSKLNHRCGVFQTILEGRYVMLLCSFASIWFGFLYGDFGSIPVVLFESKYKTGRTYPFGIDPIWHHADNKTVFINSVKMKLSLILGFVHMSLGSLISIWNAIYFKDKLTLMCTAIPQFVIFTLFLGYLVFLCVYKWLVTVNHPSLVNTLIGMYTSPFSIADQMYPGQLYVQLFIFSIILFCIPWMFFSKPVYLILKKKIPNEGALDLWISSGIHVIEFGLGLISNTSSYLRLWAVSLAHVQLTSVLHQFTIGNSNWFVSIGLFPVYIVCTLLLLIGLEGLSASLHALRLNWIEFFSKFYSGGGTALEPLTFNLKYEDIYENVSS
ncbi:V-type H+-transporting ATPase subunit a [Pancytospora epiphaga]|nr:V-type H+-transporting ATPase subunit a [Pancytospora epiphaga]